MLVWPEFWPDLGRGRVDLQANEGRMILAKSDLKDLKALVQFFTPEIQVAGKPEAQFTQASAVRYAVAGELCGQTQVF